MNPFTGFQPDLDPATSGVIQDCQSLIPTLRGMAADKSFEAIAPALASACTGATLTFKLDGTFRQFAGTATKLYEFSGGAWVDVTRAAGNYTGGVDSRWSFAQFGNISIASNGADGIQYSNSGAFADISTAPKAKIVEVVSGFVMAFNTTASATSAAGGDSPDGWWCSGLYDYSTWNPSVTTQAAYGRFLDDRGPVIAARRLGDSIVVYKNRAIYIGQYVGPPVIWSWQQISSKVGTVSAESVVNIGTAHVFWSDFDSNFYIFDGSRPVPIGDDIKKWWMNDSNPAYRYKMQGLYDKENSLVRFYYVSNSTTGTNPDHCVVYHVTTGRWGRSDATIESICEATTPAVTYDGYPGYAGAHYDDSQPLAYDSPLWISATPIISYVNTSHVLGNLIGTPGSSLLVTGNIGDDADVTSVRRVRGHFLTKPSVCALQGERKMNAGDAFSTTTTSANLNGAKFDLLQSARWHRFRMTSTGPMEISGIDLDMDRRAGR